MRHVLPCFGLLLHWMAWGLAMSACLALPLWVLWRYGR